MDELSFNDDEMRREQARKNYKKQGSHLDLRELNDVLYNAGFDFQVYEADSQHILVAGSFDITLYDQAYFKFQGIHYTNLKVDDLWRDAWHSDQILLFDREKRRLHEAFLGISFPQTAKMYQFVGPSLDDPNAGLIVADAFEYEFLVQ